MLEIRIDSLVPCLKVQAADQFLLSQNLLKLLYVLRTLAQHHVKNQNVLYLHILMVQCEKNQ